MAGALAARAGEVPPDPEPAAAPDELSRTIAEHDRRTVARTVGLWSVRASVPQRLSGSVGALWAKLPADWDCTTVCDFRGWMVSAEPGLAGGQLSVGWATVFGEFRRNRHFLADVFMAYGVRGSLLRTWGDASLRPRDQTLLGLEADFTIIMLNISAGIFRQVGGEDADDPWVATVGLGWGF